MKNENHKQPIEEAISRIHMYSKYKLIDTREKWQ